MTGSLSTCRIENPATSKPDSQIQRFKNAVGDRQIIGVRQAEKPAKFLERQAAVKEKVQDLHADRMQFHRQAGKNIGRHGMPVYAESMILSASISLVGEPEAAGGLAPRRVWRGSPIFSRPTARYRLSGHVQ